MNTLMADDQIWIVGESSPRWDVVDARPRQGCVKLFDRLAKQELYKPMSEITQALVEGHMSIQRFGLPRVNLPRQADPTLEDKLHQAMQAVRAVKDATKKYGLSTSKAYGKAREAHESQVEAAWRFPSRPTVYRYLKAARNRLPLLRGDKNKGNRNPRYSNEVVKLVEHAANTFYLKNGSTWTLKDLISHVNDTARDHGLLPAGANISREFVRKTIYENLSVDPEIDRMDPKLVAAAKSIAKNRIVVAVPFERVEQDAVHLPFIVKTVHGNVSNAYLIHSIDCSTGMPVGWYLMVGAPSESDGLKCVESILFPKDEAFKRLSLYGLPSICGAPHLIVFDNGPEARGERMKKLVNLGVDTLHCKSRHAHGKPFIERLNRSLKEALQILPGCTRMDGKDGARDPIALGDDLMTLDELERWIVRWYYENWAHTELKRHLRSDFHEPVKIGRTPNARWTKMFDELAYPMPLPPARSEWLMTLYEHEEKTISRNTGIGTRGFNYRGDNLKYLVERFGERKVPILVDPDDYRQILVDQGDGLPLVPLTETYVDENTPAYSFADMKRKMEELDSSAEDPRKIAFRRDVRKRASERALRSSSNKVSKAEQNRMVAAAHKDKQAVQRASQKPLQKVENTSDGSSPTTKFSFEDVPALDVLDRVTGRGSE